MSGDSSDEFELEKVCSPEKLKRFKVVPRDKNYTFKFKDAKGKTFSYFEYTLSAGKPLPRSTTLKGMILCGHLLLSSKVISGKVVSFDEYLEPSITGMFLLPVKDKAIFVFKEVGKYIKNTL